MSSIPLLCWPSSLCTCKDLTSIFTTGRYLAVLKYWDQSASRKTEKLLVWQCLWSRPLGFCLILNHLKLAIKMLSLFFGNEWPEKIFAQVKKREMSIWKINWNVYLISLRLNFDNSQVRWRNSVSFPRQTKKNHFIVNNICIIYIWSTST